MTNFSDHLPDPGPAPTRDRPRTSSTASPAASIGHERAASRGPALGTVLCALVLLALAAGTLCWQLAGRLPAWEVSGTYVLIGLGSALALIGALASFARSRD